MSVAVDLIERMFEYGVMSAAPLRSGASGTGVVSGGDRGRSLSAVPSDPRSGVVRDLRERMRELQPELFPARELPTHPALSALLPDGALRAGGVYSLSGSYSIAFAALAAASGQGEWVAAVGLPHFGVEAAVGLGVDLDRLVIVPDPGPRWLAVLIALIDTVSVVLFRPPVQVDDGTAARLAARLRQREGALVVLGDWPRAEARVVVARREWTGIGAGWGSLSRCTIRVTTVDRLGRSVCLDGEIDGDGLTAARPSPPPALTAPAAAEQQPGEVLRLVGGAA